jgi:hypothetical protein
MATRLEEPAEEEGTYVIHLTYYDESDPPALVTPSTMFWDLVDGLGNIVNDRDGVDLAPSTYESDIVLHGLDLAIPDGVDVDVDRYVRYYGTYVSTFGVLELTGEVVFTISNHKAQA